MRFRLSEAVFDGSRFRSHKLSQHLDAGNVFFKMPGTEEKEVFFRAQNTIKHMNECFRSQCAKDGEGNSNPLQYSSLENPMDGGTW